jgi:phosphoesterase RecJ-like protein
MIMNSIIKTIKDSKCIGISFHGNPDGDALGSSLALMQGLRQLNKKIYIISKDTVPPVYKFLPFSEEVTGNCSTIIQNTDCVIVLDCGNMDRISGSLNLKNKSYKLINIDHHISNDLYGDYNFVDTNSSAVGEIVYQILQLLGLSISKDIAICLYTSLITDSGSFKYPSTTSVTHAIAGDLINAGIDFSDIHRLIFENNKFERVKLYGKVIESIELHHNGELCYMELTKKMLEDCHIEASDTSDIIALGASIASAEVIALLKETDKGIKVSLRSKKKVDVRMVADAFSGGGHIRAAGLSIDKSLDEAKDMIINALEKELI